MPLPCEGTALSRRNNKMRGTQYAFPAFLFCAWRTILAVEAKTDRHIDGVCRCFQDVLQLLLDELFDGERRDIACASDGHRDAPDPATVGIESLIDQLGDVAEDGIAWA